MLVVLERLTLALATFVLGKKTFDVFSRKIDLNKLYSAKEAAKLFGTTEKEVMAFIEAKELKAKKVGRVYIITGKEIIRFLSE
ncbi:MAG: helix-turn-helix domain-containing protein [Deltaproteobacteria bacterium]|nr:helix-turn-helix domain-containing protein [Deltaproteobacteria bacterium]